MLPQASVKMVLGFRKRGEPEEITPDVAPENGSGDGTPPETAQASGVEALSTLKQFEKMHHLDPNLPLDELNEVDNVLAEDNAEKGVAIEQVLVEDNSPYPEVSAPSRAVRLT